MSQNSSWAKLVSNSNFHRLRLDSSEEADDQNPWEKVQDQKNKKSLKNASQRKSDSNKSVSLYLIHTPRKHFLIVENHCRT